MRYLAEVAIVFSVDTEEQRAFDLWESRLVLDSESSRHALELALSNSRALLNDPKNWQALGYSSSPCFLAIKSIHTEIELTGKSAKCAAGCMTLTKTATLDESEMTRITALEEVLIPYRVMYPGQ
jgi:hypothetical protein